jgi:uncharacterized membrane protein
VQFDAGDTCELPEGEKAVLVEVGRYQHEGIDRTAITVLTGYKRSTRDAYIYRLKGKKFLEEKGDRIIINQAGVEALGAAFESMPQTGEDLQTYWLARLPEGEAKILKLLIENGGKPMDREALTEETGFQRSTRDAYIHRLSAKYLVENEGRGAIKASEKLFA